MGKRIVHYINQFFGQIGGEEQAYYEPEVRKGAFGPGVGLQQLLPAGTEIVATVICGDSYFAENIEKAAEWIVEQIAPYRPDLFIAGPAFNAGRYGVACGAICKAVKDALAIPVLSGMYAENPGAELYAKDVVMYNSGNSAADMRKALPAMAGLAEKLLNGQALGFPEEEGTIPQGFRVNIWAEKTGAVRAVDMLLNKLSGKPFQTELPMPVFDRVEPASAMASLADATVALVTSGGIVPVGNPDRIESANASKFGRYSIQGKTDLSAEEFTTVHGGYDPVYAMEDPDRVLPLDAMRVLESEGRFKKLHDVFYATVGNTTAVSSAVKYGNLIGQELIESGVDGVILTST